MTACEYQETPLTWADNTGLFVTWVLYEEVAECSQGGAFTANNQKQNIELKIIRGNTYEYSKDGEITQSGTFIFNREEISFTPPIYPNNIGINLAYEFLGPTIHITSTELINSTSTETCSVKRNYRRKR